MNISIYVKVEYEAIAIVALRKYCVSKLLWHWYTLIFAFRRRDLHLVCDFATVASLSVTTVDIGMLLSGEIFGAVVAVLRGVDAGGDLSVFSVLAECARRTESIMKSKAARTTSSTTFISVASQELILTVVVRFTDVKDALTPHCDQASNDTMVFIFLCKVPVKTFYDP